MPVEEHPHLSQVVFSFDSSMNVAAPFQSVRAAGLFGKIHERHGLWKRLCVFIDPFCHETCSKERAMDLAKKYKRLAPLLETDAKSGRKFAARGRKKLANFVNLQRKNRLSNVAGHCLASPSLGVVGLVVLEALDQGVSLQQCARIMRTPLAFGSIEEVGAYKDVQDLVLAVICLLTKLLSLKGVERSFCRYLLEMIRDHTDQLEQRTTVVVTSVAEAYNGGVAERLCAYALSILLQPTHTKNAIELEHIHSFVQSSIQVGVSPMLCASMLRVGNEVFCDVLESEDTDKDDGDELGNLSSNNRNIVSFERSVRILQDKGVHVERRATLHNVRDDVDHIVVSALENGVEPSICSLFLHYHHLVMCNDLLPEEISKEERHREENVSKPRSESFEKLRSTEVDLDVENKYRCNVYRAFVVKAYECRVVSKSTFDDLIVHNTTTNMCVMDDIMRLIVAALKCEHFSVDECRECVQTCTAITEKEKKRKESYLKALRRGVSRSYALDTIKLIDCAQLYKSFETKMNASGNREAHVHAHIALPPAMRSRPLHVSHTIPFLGLHSVIRHRSSPKRMMTTKKLKKKNSNIQSPLLASNRTQRTGVVGISRRESIQPDEGLIPVQEMMKMLWRIFTSYALWHASPTDPDHMSSASAVKLLTDYARYANEAGRELERGAKAPVVRTKVVSSTCETLTSRSQMETLIFLATRRVQRKDTEFYAHALKCGHRVRKLMFFDVLRILIGLSMPCMSHRNHVCCACTAQHIMERSSDVAQSLLSQILVSPTIPLTTRQMTRITQFKLFVRKMLMPSVLVYTPVPLDYAFMNISTTDEGRYQSAVRHRVRAVLGKELSNAFDELFHSFRCFYFARRVFNQTGGYLLKDSNRVHDCFWKRRVSGAKNKVGRLFWPQFQLLCTFIEARGDWISFRTVLMAFVDSARHHAEFASPVENKSEENIIVCARSLTLDGFYEALLRLSIVTSTETLSLQNLDARVGLTNLQGEDVLLHTLIAFLKYLHIQLGPLPHRGYSRNAFDRHREFLPGRQRRALSEFWKALSNFSVIHEGAFGI